MEPKIIDTNDLNRKPFTAAIVALAAISLLAGASVSATLVEFAAPEYAEDDPFAGALDDATGEESWGEMKTDDRGVKKHAKDFVKRAMKNRIDDRSEDRAEHLEIRIKADNTLIVAFQYCMDSAECAGDTDVLSEMVTRLTTRTQDMQARLDGTEILDSAKDAPEMTAGDCNAKGGEWSEEKSFCEFSEKDWVERKNWSDDDKVEFAGHKMEQLEAARIAIAFCMESDVCDADSETLRMIVTHMTIRTNHHRECTDDRKCDRDHDDRRGLVHRINLAFCERTDRCDGPDIDHDWRENDFYEITQEACEERGGIWTSAPDRVEGYYCDWGEEDSGSDEDRESDESDRDDSDEEPGR